MLEVLLLRHGKADSNLPYRDDHERPLTSQGVRDAKLMGQFLRRLDWEPDRTLTSTAERARNTLESVIQSAGWDCRVEAMRELYEAAAASVMDRLRGFTPKVRRVLLVGHNPTWEEFTALSIGGGRCKLSTCGLAAIRFAAGRWEEVAPGRGTLLWMVKPKLLGRSEG